MLSDAWLFIGSQGKLRAPVVESQVPAYTRPQAPAKQEAGDHENHQPEARQSKPSSPLLRRGYSRFPVVDSASGQAQPNKDPKHVSNSKGPE